MRVMNKWWALYFCLLAGCASDGPSGNHGGGNDTPSDPLVGWIHARREIEIRRQAPQLGIPVDLALSVRVNSIKICNETGRSGDGSYSCDGGCTETGCVHAWFKGYKGATKVDYLFVGPVVTEGCIAHEVHHELMVVWYGIGGHPAESTITRIDNGKSQRVKHASVIGWRWPSLVNWALPQSLEIQSDWQDDIHCGFDDVLIDGAGI